MKNSKILIVEDQLLIAEDIKNKLEKRGYEITEMVQRGEDVLSAMQQNRADLVIMDIKLEGKTDGINAAAKMKEEYDIPVVFLTDRSDDKTIKRAGKTKPAAYLLKPFTEIQLHASIKTALFNASEKKEANVVETKSVSEQSYLVNNAVFVKDDGSFKKLEIEDILFLEADRAYCAIHTVTKGKITIAKSMNVVFDSIQSDLLVRIHRSFIVNKEKINEIKGNIVVIGKNEIPVGESYRADLNKRFRFVK